MISLQNAQALSLGLGLATASACSFDASMNITAEGTDTETTLATESGEETTDTGVMETDSGTETGPSDNFTLCLKAPTTSGTLARWTNFTWTLGDGTAIDGRTDADGWPRYVDTNNQIVPDAFVCAEGLPAGELIQSSLIYFAPVMEGNQMTFASDLLPAQGGADSLQWVETQALFETDCESVVAEECGGVPQLAAQVVPDAETGGLIFVNDVPFTMIPGFSDYPKEPIDKTVLRRVEHRLSLNADFAQILGITPSPNLLLFGALDGEDNRNFATQYRTYILPEPELQQQYGFVGPTEEFCARPEGLDEIVFNSLHFTSLEWQFRLVTIGESGSGFLPGPVSVSDPFPFGGNTGFPGTVGETARGADDLSLHAGFGGTFLYSQKNSSEKVIVWRDAFSSVGYGHDASSRIAVLVVSPERNKENISDLVACFGFSPGEVGAGMTFTNEGFLKSHLTPEEVAAMTGSNTPGSQYTFAMELTR